MVLLRNFLQPLLLSSFLFVGLAANAEFDCDKAYKLLNRALYQPSVPDLLRPESSIKTPYQRFVDAFNGADHAALESIFEGPNAIKLADIDSLWFAMSSRQRGFRTNTNFVEYVGFLRRIGLSHPSLFDGASDAVERIKRVISNPSNRSNPFGGTGKVEVSMANLLTSEENLIIQAMMEMRGRGNQSTRWFDGYNNTFSPHRDRVADIIDFNAKMREALNLTAIADTPIARFKELYSADLSGAEQDIFAGLLNDTKSKIEELFAIVKDGFGTDLSQSTVAIGDLRLRRLEEKLAELNAGGKLKSAVQEAEADMDKLEAVVAGVRKRKGLPEEHFEEMHDQQLQIRYNQHDRQSGELKSKYSGLTNDKVKNTDYKVEAEWTVTVDFVRYEKRTVREPVYKEGKLSHYEDREVTDTIRFSETYSQSGDFTLKADYNELLDGEISPSASELDLPPAQTRSSSMHWNATPTDASNGTPRITWKDTNRIQKILGDSKKAMDLENAIRRPLTRALKEIEGWVAQYSNIRSSNSARDTALAGIDQSLKELILLLEKESKDFSTMDSAAFKALWPNGDFAHFQSRGKILLSRNQQLVARLKYFREQVRRQIETLNFFTPTPDYSNQLALLDRLAGRRWVSFGIKHTLLAAAIGLGIYAHVNPAANHYVQAKWNKITEWYKNVTGADEEPVIRWDEGQSTQTPESPTRQ